VSVVYKGPGAKGKRRLKIGGLKAKGKRLRELRGRGLSYK